MRIVVLRRAVGSGDTTTARWVLLQARDQVRGTAPKALQADLAARKAPCPTKGSFKVDDALSSSRVGSFHSLVKGAKDGV
jgi:hypothetical protein